MRIFYSLRGTFTCNLQVAGREVSGGGEKKYKKGYDPAITPMIADSHALERISLFFPCSFFMETVNPIPFSVPLSNFFVVEL